MQTPTKIAAVAVAVIAAAGLGAYLKDDGSKAGAQTVAPTINLPSDRSAISVIGHGKVEGRPDLMTMELGVETRDASAQSALQQNAQKAQGLIDELKRNGVADKDIQTLDVSINPTWDDHGHINGYSASNTVTVKVRNLDNAGKIIDAAASKAGDAIRLNGVTFSIDDTSALYAKARADAVKDAMAQAKQLADAGGVNVGAIHSMDTTGTEMPQPLYYGNFRAAKMAADAVAAPTPVETGTQQLTVDVTVVFDLAG